LSKNHLHLERPIAFFDLETTGLDIAKDRIVEVAVLKVFPDGKEEVYTQRVNPEMPIPAETSDIHGIFQADIENEPTFREIAPKLAIMLMDSDLGGFNSNHFDIPLLLEEFLRVDINFDIEGKHLVDVQKIFHKKEPRNLAAAVRFYCNKELENAHSAEADIRATYDVLLGQLERYSDLRKGVEQLHKFSQQGSRRIDFAGRFVYNKEKQACFNFGKHKGKTVEQVLSNEPGYYAWMMKSDFSLNTKQALTKIKTALDK
jgi:DNA polymerase-3 subunit epsilon